MDRKELKKANGDVFFTAERELDNSYIHAAWIGIQSLETLMYGAAYLITMLQKMPCIAILYDNKELIGPWEQGALYLGNIWAPKANQLGLKNFAQITAPGIYGQKSFAKFEHLAKNYFNMETFDHQADARAWILKVNQISSSI